MATVASALTKKETDLTNAKKDMTQYARFMGAGHIRQPPI